MKKYRYIAFSIVIAGLFSTSCASDVVDDEPIGAGKDAFALSGISLNSVAATTGSSNLYLMARLTEDASKIYVGEIPIDIPALSAVASPIIFPVGKPTYPLMDKEINIFAYTGKAPNGKMKLQAGKGVGFDAVLSNNGMQSSTMVIDPTNEGKGTLGSALDHASLLQFRHVMTQINVDIVVDSNELPAPVDPAPKNIKIKMPSLVANGSYAITAKVPVSGNETSADKATSTSGEYTLQKGVNYVIPNGENLKGKGFSSLVIDDYTATADDLLAYTIQPEGTATDFYLLSGYSYNLTLTVARLKVTSIKLTPVPWKPEEVKDSDVSYDAYKLDLDFGSYQNTADDLITKVVLYTTDSKTYVGGTDAVDTDVKFVTLPANGKVNKVDIYTDKGLLLSTDITNEYQNANQTAKLTMKLSVGGMVPENAGQPAGQNNPYLITTPLQLLNVDKELSGHYKLASNIGMSSLRITEFKGLGQFSGTFDGNGYWFSNINISGAGLFEVNDGTLKNIRIYTGSINAKGIAFAGGIAGTNNGTIVSCFNEVSIDNSTATVGGIVGQNSATGKVIACLNTGRITKGLVVGGLVGTNKNTNAGAISASVNVGTLNPLALKLGGIAGTSEPSTNSIINSCYWLIGSAERYIGSKETAVDSNNVTRTNTSSRDANELRNGISEGDTEADRIVNKLNAEIALFSDWKNAYQYVLDPLNTGSTWPVPQKK